MKNNKIILLLPFLFAFALSAGNNNTNSAKSLVNKTLLKANEKAQSKVDVIMNFEEDKAQFVAKYEKNKPASAPSDANPFGKIGSTVLKEAPGKLGGLLYASKGGPGSDGGYGFRGNGAYAARSTNNSINFIKDKDTNNTTLNIKLKAKETWYQPYFLEQVTNTDISDITKTDFIQYRVKNTTGDVAICNFHIGDLKYDNNPKNPAYSKAIGETEWKLLPYRDFPKGKPGHLVDGKGTATYHCMVIPKGFDGYIRYDAVKAKTKPMHKLITYFESIEGATDLYIDDIAKVGASQVRGVSEDRYFNPTTAPANLVAVDATSSTATDGKITGVDETMEYRAENSETYTTITGTELTNLAAGKYFVRYKEAFKVPASEEATITVGAPEPHVHEWSEWTVTKPATCTEKGIETRTCTCGEKETREIAALGHKEATRKENVIEATCTTDGSYDLVTYCETCNEVLKTEHKIVKATGHTFGEWTVTKPATCTEKGIETRTCTCGETETREIEMIAHDYETEWTVDKEATCTEAGSKSHHCKNCDAKTDVTEIPALGHTFGEWKVTKPATCTEKGIETRTCTCGETETRDIPALGHKEATRKENVVEATCTTDGSYDLVTYCETCNEVIKTEHKTIKATGHNFGEWTVVKEATAEAEGLEKRTCPVCGETEERVIPKLETPVTPDPETPEQPANNGLAIGLGIGIPAVVIAAGIGTYFIIKRRKH